MRTTLSWFLLGVLALLGSQPSDAGTGEPTTPGAHRSGALDFDRYVAIGDSYTSGAGIPPGGLGDCFRSSRNYPHLLGHKLAVHVVDVSCGGATTANLLTAEPANGYLNAPQLDGLNRRTDLVTVSLGINDAGLGTLISRCLAVAESDSEGSPCRQSYQSPAGDALLASLPEVGRRVARSLHLVHQRAPHAEVVLVGYPQLVPDNVTCPQLPFATGDYAYAAQFFVTVDTTLAAAARDADVTYVSLLEPSRGHDICAGEKAWVLGNTPDPRTMTWHPFVREQRAVARLIRRALRAEDHASR